MSGWTALEEIIQEELIQLDQEGYEVNELREQVVTLDRDRKALLRVYDELQNSPRKKHFPFFEPNDLESIQKERPAGPRQLNAEWNHDEWMDKFYGAWLGRCAGCALGKPLEAFITEEGGVPGWKRVKEWYEGADAWPIRGYCPTESKAAESAGLTIWAPDSTLGRIRFMESDDDIRYTVLGLTMMENKGLDWDSWDTGLLWHKELRFAQVCTAETQAYMNFAQIARRMKGRPSDWMEQMDWIRSYLNPYREWIGAQIRVDGLAYCVAGRTQLAAELAWRDASFSHVKNGVYGAMYVAAMIAAAFVQSDVRTIVNIGMSEIPRNCRLAYDLRLAIEIADRSGSQEELVQQIWSAFKHYNPVHTNNNAALLTAALLYSEGDFEKAITTAVAGGWDTDCNGATVGSIMGAMLGAQRLPDSWISPLNDTLYADVRGFHPISISECARRSYDVFQKIRYVHQ